jgi:hypothetical protein
MPQYQVRIPATITRSCDKLLQNFAFLFFARATILSGGRFGNFLPPPSSLASLSLPVRSNTGGKTHFISSGFLNEATNAIWSEFLMSQFESLTELGREGNVTTDSTIFRLVHKSLSLQRISLHQPNRLLS